MKRRLIFIFSMLLTTTLYSQRYEIGHLDELISSGEVETDGTENTFSKRAAAKEFAAEYGLSADELELIGTWVGIMTTPVEQTHYNVRILSVQYFPNRIQCMNCISGGRRIRIFSRWKVNGSEIFMAPYYILESDMDCSQIKVIYHEEKPGYIPAFALPDFSGIYVITEAMNYSFLNPFIQNEDYEFKTDTVRYRITHEFGEPSVFDLMTDRDDVKELFLHSDFGSLETIREL